jgi:hypothetical protein
MYQEKIERIIAETLRNFGLCGLHYEENQQSGNTDFELHKYALDGIYVYALGKLYSLLQSEPSLEGKREIYSKIVSLRPPYDDEHLTSIHSAIIGQSAQYLMATVQDENSKNKPTEESYRKSLIQIFSTIKEFNSYVIVGTEAYLSQEDKDRVDVLAKCTETDRDVIIELKLGNKSAHKQLRSYAVHYENPILINITETTVKRKRHDILYFTFDELGVEPSL